MNRLAGILLALAAIVAGSVFFGWKGAILGLSCIVFFLLLQFSQLMRVMRTAQNAPLGHVASAVMLHSKLHAGMKLLDLIRMCGSLGVKVDPNTYRWTDAGGDAVDVVLERSLVTRWTLIRAADAQAHTGAPSDTPAA
ncbi:hypothetical protein [Mitsuaria sp. BK037]|uniref:hypothetical protein n=1 Tax=Mitsuaria sp. BK037 TaxID=2587122 RepID=UPI001610C9B2|nr:hypothetical protein [Mitsuaria sp. BK037]MBB3283654.1 hypothetical protein [Mitsuaria sp. BK037]